MTAKKTWKRQEKKGVGNERRITMGLMNMENNLENMLNSMKEELGEETDKKEKQPQKTKKDDIDLDELLKSIPDLMTKEKRKQSAVSERKTVKAGPIERSAAEKRAAEKKAGREAVHKEKVREQIEQLSVEDMFDIEKLKEKKKEKVKQKKHILIVDDDIRVLKMMKEVLKNDYDTAVASNGDIAMKFLDKHGTDLILLDYMMPGENGKEVLERIRQNPKYYDIPVFFLTGMSDAEKVQECLALRPQGYMLKPVKQFELLRRVKEILG
jgi:CheY-like chemotaxis protein